MPATLSPARACAFLARAAARLDRHFPGLATVFLHGPDWLVFRVRRGEVPPEAIRSLNPGVRPALQPPSEDELRVLACLAAGPLTGPALAARLDLEPTGGGFKRKMAAIQKRGLVTCDQDGYQATEYGAWAASRDGP